MDRVKKIKWLLSLLAWFKIPMIGFTKLKIESLDDETAVIKVPLNRRTKNHLNSMYIGSLVVGADIAGGVHAFYYADKIGKKVSFAFKDMKASFLKRAESDITFECHDGKKVMDAINASMESGERVNESTVVKAYDKEREIVAEFEMTISVKCK